MRVKILVCFDSFRHCDTSKNLSRVTCLDCHNCHAESGGLCRNSSGLCKPLSEPQTLCILAANSRGKLTGCILQTWRLVKHAHKNWVMAEGHSICSVKNLVNGHRNNERHSMPIYSMNMKNSQSSFGAPLHCLLHQWMAGQSILEPMRHVWNLWRQPWETCSPSPPESFQDHLPPNFPNVMPCLNLCRSVTQMELERSEEEKAPASYVQGIMNGILQGISEEADHMTKMFGHYPCRIPLVTTAARGSTFAFGSASRFNHTSRRTTAQLLQPRLVNTMNGKRWRLFQFTSAALSEWASLLHLEPESIDFVLRKNPWWDFNFFFTISPGIKKK